MSTWTWVEEEVHHSNSQTGSARAVSLTVCEYLKMPGLELTGRWAAMTAKGANPPSTAEPATSGFHAGWVKTRVKARLPMTSAYYPFRSHPAAPIADIQTGPLPGGAPGGNRGPVTVRERTAGSRTDREPTRPPPGSAGRSGLFRGRREYPARRWATPDR